MRRAFPVAKRKLSCRAPGRCTLTQRRLALLLGLTYNLCRFSSQQSESDYGARRAAYDLKKLRGKQLVRRMGKTAKYEPIPTGLRPMTALLVLRDQAIKPLLAAAQQPRLSRGPQNPRPLDIHYQTICAGMQGVFKELGIAA